MRLARKNLFVLLCGLVLLDGCVTAVIPQKPETSQPIKVFSDKSLPRDEYAVLRSGSDKKYRVFIHRVDSVNSSLEQADEFDILPGQHKIGIHIVYEPGNNKSYMLRSNKMLEFTARHGKTYEVHAFIGDMVETGKDKFGGKNYRAKTYVWIVELETGKVIAGTQKPN